MNVLLTGSAGFVGRAFDRQLTARGHTVTRVDIADPDQPCDARGFFAANRDQFDLVIHLAAVVGGRARIDGTPLDLAVNLAIDADLFAWAARTEPAKIVYFSSSAAYPTRLQQPGVFRQLAEDDISLRHPERPDAIYGWAKLTGEMLADLARRSGLDVLVARPFSGYGSDQALDYPFPSFIDRARRRADPFHIWGDGTQVRDWIHIDDIVNATLTAVDQHIPGPINLGSGHGTSFNDLARLVCDQAGYTPRFEHLHAQPAGVHRRVADATLMRGFHTPAVSIEDGIRRAFADMHQVAA